LDTSNAVRSRQLPSPASSLKRWTQRFDDLDFTRRACLRNRQPRIQTARAWLVEIIGPQGLVRLQGESRLRRLARKPAMANDLAKKRSPGDPSRRPAF
jgi:hypothetical protein